VEDVDRNERLSGGVIHTMRSRVLAVTRTAALLGAVALGVPAAGAAASRGPSQWVTTDRIVAHDVRFAVQPNATQTFELPLAEMALPRAVLVQCWGFDLTGPGVDLAAAGLKTYGWAGAPEKRRPYADPQAQLGADGWYLPESRAVVGAREFQEGADCRRIGWSRFVETGSGIASAAEVRRARQRPHVFVRIAHPRRRTKAPPANRLDDGSVQLPLAGLRLLRDSRQMRLVVRVVAGPLAGPTTIVLHARVLVRR
jgi:hypothetical protein